MLIKNIYLGGFSGECNYCNRLLGNTEFTFKLQSIILENEPIIIICEQCIFEKLLNKSFNINMERFVKYKVGTKKAKRWWRFW